VHALDATTSAPFVVLSLLAQSLDCLMVPDRGAPGEPTLGQMVRVVVVEDDPSHRERFRHHLRLDDRLTLIAEFANATTAMAAIPPLIPDVALVDLGLPDKTGFDVIAHIHHAAPRAEIMVVSVFGGERNLLRAIEAGATGYLLKDAMPPDFLAAIHALRAGESPISPSLARHLLNRYRPVTEPQGGGDLAPSDAGGEGLTAREIDILERIASGASIAEIAQLLFLSTHTVKTHVKNIYRKLEAHSRVQAVSIAQRRHIIGPGG
jgi:DNA-binding NarL/FixJ family response regulator